MKTTLNRIKAQHPYAYLWENLLAYLGKTEADDEPLSIQTILDSNGFDDVLWALRAVDGYDKEIRLLACDYAERVLPIYESQYPGDIRVRDCITTARQYAIGGVSEKELDAARDAAWDAIGDASCDAARAAAWDAIGDASYDATVDAARAAAGAAVAAGAARAVRAAAGAARLAAGGAAWDAAGAAVDWQTGRLIDLLTAKQADESTDTEKE